MRHRYQRGPSGTACRWVVTIRRAYDRATWQRRTTRPVPMAPAAVAVAAAASVGWRAVVLVAVVAGLLAAVSLADPLRPRPVWHLALLVVVASLGAVRADDARAAATPQRLGQVATWVMVVDDPQSYRSATRAIVEVGEQRYEIWARGRAFRGRVGEWRGGEWHHVVGELVVLDAERAGRVAWQHVVGELRVEYVGDRMAGSPLARASNRVRAAIERGASTMGEADGSLFRGLVIGDDRDQPREMIDRFRASGLSHLTAVSGQNVAFVLAASGPLLRRLRPWVRWAVTLALIGWFVSLTRFEPSIVRAGTMAMLAATAFVTGRRADPVRLLSLAVVVLVLVDPLIVGSVGFWLSVGATFGVAAIGPRLAACWGGLGWMAMPLGITLGAQIGVVVPAVVVFGRLPLVSIPANLLAVPVGGAVMLYGLPTGIVAGMMPAIAPVVLLPCKIGVRWVDTVAALGAAVEPGGRATWVGWGVVAVVVVAVTARAAMHRDRHGSSTAHR